MAVRRMRSQGEFAALTPAQALKDDLLAGNAGHGVWLVSSDMRSVNSLGFNSRAIGQAETLVAWRNPSAAYHRGFTG